MTENLTLGETFDEMMQAEMSAEFATLSSGESLADNQSLGEVSLRAEIQPFGSQLAETLPENVGVDTLNPRATMPTGTTTTSLAPNGSRVTDDTRVTDKD